MKKILIIDDDRVSHVAAKAVLGKEYELVTVTDGMQGVKYLEENTCDLILLDIKMPGMNGFETYEEIRKNEKNVNIPVIFLTADNDADTETKCFEYGARDFIGKPFVKSVIKSRVNRTMELEELRATLAMRLDQKIQEVDQMKTKSYTDALTGLWNREYAELKIDEMIQAGDRGSLFMIDLDNFKGINDNYGHQEGDRVLNMFADTLREYTSDKDVLCRIGGDEYIAYISNRQNRTDISNLAADMIRSLNKRIAEMAYEVKTSVSIGIATAGTDGEDFAKLYNCGDKALYYVKSNGKNSFRFYSDNTKEKSERAGFSVDLAYLSVILSRSDSGHGAYMLDFDSFNNVYIFLKRFVERSNHQLVSVLFNAVSTVEGEPVNPAEADAVLELLDKAIFTSLRRVDISTRYSSMQTMVVLVDTDIENGTNVVERILDCFDKLYFGDKIKIEYSMAEIKRTQNNK